MKLDIRHSFPCTPARFWEMYWDDTYDAMLREGATFDRELVEERTEGGLAVRRLRFTPHQDLPAAAARIVGSTKLVYDQENKYDAANGVLHWQVIPSFLQDKIEAKGTLEVVPAGDGCEQRVTGDIVVNVRFIGGQIEKAVVAEVGKSWNNAAEIGRAWLQKFGA